MQSVRRLFPASAIVAGQVAAVDDSAGAGNVAGARPLPAMPDIGEFDSIPSSPGDYYDLVSRNGGFTFLLNLQESQQLFHMRDSRLPRLMLNGKARTEFAVLESSPRARCKIFPGFSASLSAASPRAISPISPHARSSSRAR